IKNRYYIPNNSLLIIAGDVNTADIRKLVPRYFDRWQRGADPFVANPPVRAAPLKAPILVTDTIEEPRAIVFVRWHGPSIGLDDKGTYVADVFSEIIRQPEHPFSKSLEESGL